MSGLGQKVTSGAVWVTLSKLFGQIVHFIVGMVLARLLTPDDYGTVALLSIFFAIAGSIASCGFGNALVQKKEAGDIEFNSVFYTSVAMSFVVYAILFLVAPYIADFYHTPVLCSVTRVSAIQFVLSAINSIQGAEISRKMLFDKQFKISMITCIVSAVFGILFAFMGFGVWALVWASLLTSISGIMASWTIVAWRPKLMYSFSAVKGLFSYGWKLSLSGMIHTTYTNLYGFLVGRIYTPADLAYVNKGQSMPNLLMSTIDGTILGVSFPALAKLQDDGSRFREAVRRMVKCSTFLVFPLMAGLSLCARPLILLLYGHQWEPAIPYVQIACFGFALFPFSSINTAAISAAGRSDVFLLLEILKKGVGITLMLCTIRHGVFVFMCVMSVVQPFFGMVVNATAVGRLFGYNLRMQLVDTLPYVCLCIFMYGVVLAMQALVRSTFIHVPESYLGMFVVLLVSFVFGVIFYVGLAILFKLQAFREYVKAVQPYLNGRLPKVSVFLGKLV